MEILDSNEYPDQHSWGVIGGNHCLFYNCGCFYKVPTKEEILRLIEGLKNTLDNHEVISSEVELINEELEQLIRSSPRSKITKCNKGNLYLAYCSLTKLYKIGRTKKVEDRISTLRTANPCIELVSSSYVENMVNMERELHDFFADSKVDGEWFKLLPIDVKIINEYFIKWRIVK
jgi:hypothetical protein